MRALPLLEARRSELETCVFCPKLCRSACPVSNAEPRETVTPWGKMTVSWMAAHGDVPADASYAAPAWACTGCFACRESCDHRNGVANVLLDARDAFVRKGGAAPPAVSRVLSGFARHEERTRDRARALAAGQAAVRPSARSALLVGCAYLRGAPPEAKDALDAAAALLGEPVALVDACCGLPLRMAGDKRAFARHARAMAQSLKGKAYVLVADAGCAFALARRYPEVGVAVAAQVETLVELAARRVGKLRPRGGPRERGEREELSAVTWHDPCQLGRGLGVYDAPRDVLSRILGQAPGEFWLSHERAACSGAGGLLPSTMPEAAANIARARMAEVEGLEAPGENERRTVVTGCASSLRALRRAAPPGVVVEDIATWVARSVR